MVPVTSGQQELSSGMMESISPLIVSVFWGGTSCVGVMCGVVLVTILTLVGDSAHPVFPLLEWRCTPNTPRFRCKRLIEAVRMRSMPFEV